MLASNKSFGSAVGDAGLGVADWQFKRASQARAEQREVRADAREARNEARQISQMERQTERDRVSDERWSAEQEATKAWRAIQAGNMDRALALRAATERRLGRTGSRSGTNAFDRKMLEHFADQLADVQMEMEDLDPESPDDAKELARLRAKDERLRRQAAKILTSTDGDVPMDEGFVPGEDL